MNLHERLERLKGLFDKAPVKRTYGMTLSFNERAQALFEMPYDPAFDHALGGIREAFEYAVDGSVTARIEVCPLEDVNAVFTRMKQGRIQGRIVLGLNESSGHAGPAGVL